MPSGILKDCSKLLGEKELTIACAESATAGRMMAELALLAESGKVLKGGLVCYDASIKTDILKVSKELLEEFSPESAEVTCEVARCLKKFIPADIHVAITGLTTPGGSESADKPVGTIFACIIIHEKENLVRQVFSGSPEQIALQAIDRIAVEIIKLVDA